MKQAVELATKNFDLEGTTIELVSRDSNCDGEKAKTAAEELITQEHVVAIVGDSWSGATLGAAPVANKYKIAMVSPSATSPRITTEGGDYVFRTIPSDTYQGTYAAKLMQQAGSKRLGIVYSNEPYGQGLSEVVKKEFEKLGGTVVAYEPVPHASTDVNAALTKIKAANPDTLYMVNGSGAGRGAVLLSAKSLGLKVKLFGSEDFMDKTVINDAADAAEGLVVTAVSDGTSAFRAKYRAAYDADQAGEFTAQAYDAFMAIGETLKKGANTGEKIKDALYKVDFEGASGHIKFDANGDIVGGSYDVFTVKAGQLVASTQ
jgi:branched-chain amino acid transport system substrate-binding protein